MRATFQVRVFTLPRVIQFFGKFLRLKGWHFIIYENLVDKKLVENSQRNGYLDFKKLMFGNAASGPLSLHLSVVKEGPVCVFIVCWYCCI
jgi:hypothetical protein